jgi:site-specific recombinase XerD
MKNSSSALASILEKFFTERLMNQKRVSNETVMAYRDTFRLLLKYAQRELGKKPSKLLLDDLDASLICKFLNHLEVDRHNTPRTRNHRLAAIRSFFHYASFEEPQLSAHIQRVLAIPTKRYQKREIDFLTVDEVDAILDAIDRSTWLGRRDHTLISLTVHTGLRVSELTNLCCNDVTLGAGAYVHCNGKGRKDRSCLWAERLRQSLSIGSARGPVSPQFLYSPPDKETNSAGTRSNTSSANMHPWPGDAVHHF